MKWLLIVLVHTPDGVIAAHQPFSTAAACDRAVATTQAELIVPYPFTAFCLDISQGERA